MLVRLLCGMLSAAALTAGPVVAPAAAAPGVGKAAPSLTGPTTAHVGDIYTVTASGFTPGALVPLEIAEADGCCIALNLVAGFDGTFTYSGEVWAPGAYRVRAWVARNGGRWRVAASWSFDAYPQG
jgi:hypothetical protein